MFYDQPLYLVLTTIYRIAQKKTLPNRLRKCLNSSYYISPVRMA